MRSGEGNPFFLRLPQPRWTRGHMQLLTAPLLHSQGDGFFQSFFPSSLKEKYGFQGKSCCLNLVHWPLQSRMQVWIQVGGIFEEKVCIFDATSAGSRFKLCWLSEEEVDLAPPEHRQLGKDRGSTYNRSGTTGRWTIKSQWGDPSPFFFQQQ